MKSTRFALPTSILAIAVLLSLPNFASAADARPAAAGKEGLFTLPGKTPNIPNKIPSIEYDLNLAQEKFYLRIPLGYKDQRPHGLFVFTNHSDRMGIPKDWKSVLARHKLIYVAPQNVGNDKFTNRRVGMTVVAIHKMMELYKIDPKRVYVGGLSGGAKIACIIGFLNPDLVSGTVPMCGVVFPAPHSGFQCDPKLAEKAKAKVGFALVTGARDFNHGGMLNCYEHAFVPKQYRAKVFDVPNMGHTYASGKTLNSALNWLEQGDAKPDQGKPEKPAGSNTPRIGTRSRR